MWSAWLPTSQKSVDGEVCTHTNGSCTQLIFLYTIMMPIFTNFVNYFGCSQCMNNKAYMPVKKLMAYMLILSVGRWMWVFEHVFVGLQLLLPVLKKGILWLSIASRRNAIISYRSRCLGGPASPLGSWEDQVAQHTWYYIQTHTKSPPHIEVLAEQCAPSK